MPDIEIIRFVSDAFGNLGALLLIAAIGFALVAMLRTKGRIDAVQANLYEQLRQELIDARGEISHLNTSVLALQEEKTVLREQLATMTIRIQDLEECESTLRTLKDKLEQKDDTISELRVENTMLRNEISNLKDRIHHLELRLSQDEARFSKDQ